MSPNTGTVRHLPATPWIGCLLSRAANNAVFQSAAKHQSQLSPLQRVDPEYQTSEVRKPLQEAAPKKRTLCRSLGVAHDGRRLLGDLGQWLTVRQQQEQ